MCKVAAFYACLCWQIVKARGVPKRWPAGVSQIENHRRNALILRDIVVKVPYGKFNMLRFLNSVFCSSLQVVNSDLSHWLNPFGDCRQNDAQIQRESREFCKGIR